MLSIFVLVTASIANLLIGFFTWLKNGRSPINTIFFTLTLTLVGWTVANHISLSADEPQRIYSSINWVMFFVVLQNIAFFQFTRIFPDPTRPAIPEKLNVAYLLLSGLTLFVSITATFFSGYSNVGDSISPNPSPWMALFIVQAATSILGGFLFLISKLRIYKDSSRQQIKYVLLASGALYVLVPLTNFVLPIIFDNTVFIFLSPIYALIFATIIGYAIIKHRLFDLRVIAARSIAYILLLALVIAIYLFITAVITSLLLPDDISEEYRAAVNVIAAFLIGVSLRTIKKSIDRLSDSLFFRDTYNPQQVIDNLSEVLATEIDLVGIVRKSVVILEGSIHPTHIRVVVFDEDKKPFYDYLSTSAPSTPVTYNKIDSLDKPLTLLSDMDPNIQNSFERLKADIFLKLETGEGLIGVLLIGPKQSGSFYSSQDIGLLKIIENELSVAVQNARYFEQIQKFNVTLQRKVKQATTRLEHSNEKLKALDEAKDEFISMASHQLRTPLTSIKGYLSMVLEGDAGKINRQQRKLLRESFASSQRMVYLIADLLNVSRLKTGKFVIERSEVDLSKIVSEEVEQLVPTAKSRRLKMEYARPKSFPVMSLDETKIRQVVMNFVDNAIYYTPAGGKIEVIVRRNRGAVEFLVKDDGIGIPAQSQPKLFTKFYRAENARKARPDGTGLGLFMAKKIVLAQGGSIIFKSKEGEGSTFGFRFNMQQH